MKRLFIGVPIQSESAKILVEIWKNNPELNDHMLKWTKPENWHITLIFMGNTPESAIPQLQELIDESFIGIKAFRSTIKGIGVFPNSHNPKVLWLGIENIQTLMPATQHLGALLQQNGFYLDNKPLKPHLTLARIKNSTHSGAIHSLIDQYSNFSLGLVAINKVILYESISSADGPVYKPVHVHTLSEIE